MEDLVPFPLIASGDYSPCTFDYTRAEQHGLPGLHHWIEVFRKSIPEFQKAAASDDSVPQDQRAARAKNFANRYSNILNQLENDPSAELEEFGSAKVDCLRLCWLRDTCLRMAGFVDPFARIKAEQSAQALEVLPAILAELDAHIDPMSRMRSAIEGVFAGNIFDLGAAAAAALFNGADGVKPAAGTVFRETKAKLVQRPWAVDCLDAVLERFQGPPHHKAILFVDNAGSDVVLGMLPFARELLIRGTEVVLAANAVPSINDVTFRELQDIVARSSLDGVICQAVRTNRLRVISSGSDLPVIDLRRVSAEVAAEAKNTDLVVLEGMGRGIETNLYAKLKCESLKLGMIKHPEVAALLRGRLYDCVCQYDCGDVTR